jgi:uncharacterized protein YebE (UPF0316 family)
MVWQTFFWAVVIFFSRVMDVGMGTVRVQLIVRHRKALAAAIGFFEVLIYILIVSQVINGMDDLTDINSWIKVLAYATGFAVGTFVGIILTERMGRGVVEVTIITQEPAVQLEVAVREAGFALTRYEGMGREGQVAVLSAVCNAREVPRLVKVVTRADPEAFVYTQELAGLRGGYVYGVKSKL